MSWRHHGQDVTGRGAKGRTDRTGAAGRTVGASEEGLRYEAENDSSGRSAVHGPGSPRKERGGS
ncbi:MAG TPA: DUF2945 domain-containing protein [Streptomyces sp.]|uniref:DUF2945 domain-containing protein n=1 Tax=Streptomyces sp. TaxID=1931 RepID=UPI002C059717|nr:DUF2945 domain-containing protein [Streptomyces sp.]HWU05850.1 DUF2945 domain-containing protein [Streptomyces sp.]